jgi:hypothetical protein
MNGWSEVNMDNVNKKSLLEIIPKINIYVVWGARDE